MLTLADFRSALDKLELEKRPAIVHASLRAFDDIRGGAKTVLGALLGSVSRLMMPTFTYKTMIIPDVGPPNNGLDYGKKTDLNRMAIPFQHNMPADRLVGALSETLRSQPNTIRSAHPILSFAGIHVEDVLSTQTLYSPFAPIGRLADQEGWVLLLGVNHTSNTSIHYAEKMAGRHQFVRWALMRDRIVECPGYPGCSDGFEDIRPELAEVSRRVQIGSGFIEAIPLQPLLQAVEYRIKEEPLSLLCKRDECERCDAVRAVVGE